MSMDNKQIIGITKLKLQAFSLAALEIILGAIVVKVRSMMERTSIQIATWLTSGCILGEIFHHWDQIITRFVTQNTLFVNQMTKNTLFHGIFGNNWNITTYALEHDGVTSKWENIKQNVEPCILYGSLPEIACKTVRPHTWYLSFFLHGQNFWRIKFTPKNANFSR